MNVADLLHQARALGAEFEIHLDSDRVHVSGPAPLPDDLLAALRQHKAELRRQLIIERAYALASKVDDALGQRDPLLRECNRLSWAVQDLQDAGEPEEVWLPLREEEYRIGTALGRRS